MATRTLSAQFLQVALPTLLLAALVAPSALGTSGGLPSFPVGRVLPAPGVQLPASATPSGSREEVAPAFSAPPGVLALGPVPATTPLTVAVGLSVPDPSSLSAFVSALYSPGTPQYHAFLTPSDLAQRFGPSAEAVSTGRAYFESFGLSVGQSPDHLLLTVSGPSSRVAAAFGTTFEQYRRADGGSFFSHPTPASLPAVAPWSGAYGLGNVTPLVPAATEPALRSASVSPGASCVGTPAVLAPCQIWEAYNMTSLLSAGTNGTGIRLAVVDPYSSDENQSRLTSDLAKFELLNGLSPGSVNFVYPVPDPANLNSSDYNPDWTLEDALDLEWARAAAPGATIDVTLSPNSGVGLYDAVDWLVDHQAADVISMSWGEPDVGVFNAYNTPCSAGCNASTDGSYGVLSPVLAFAAAEGISVFAASGDCGAADGTSGLSTNYPASDPDVTGVGGTGLTVNATGDYQSETGWGGNASGAQSPGCSNQGGSGGGYSPFPQPWWQAGIVPGSTHRGVPDVALDAATPVSIVLNGTGTAAAGTSLSTPVWAGIAAIADQFAGRRLGLLDPTLYAIASGQDYSRDFHDIVLGNNGYPAGPGWDPVTGLGTPRVAALVPDLVHGVSLSRSSLASFVYASPRFGLAPLTVTFHVNATGGTGTYPLEGVSFGDGNASFAQNGTTTYIFRFPGVYSAQAYVADSIANYSLSPPVAIVVGGGTDLTVALGASTAAPGTGTAVRFTVGVTGGVPPYEYNYSFGDGTFFDGSDSPTVSHVFGAAGSFCAAVVVSDSATPVDGAVSERVAIGAGGAPLPDCRNDTVPLTMTATPGVGVRDAPADFPDLFTISGGSTAAGGLPPSVQFSSSDPYLSACACAIFRAPGTYTVTGYGNDSEDEQATATTTVTVAPALVANFTASPLYGTAPLTVTFHANASGGYGANVSATRWTSSNGAGVSGAIVSFTYATPGWYVAVGHLSDLGHGNASEAFLVDVRSAAAAPSPYLVATVRPAVDVPLGAGVNLSAQMVSASGALVPSAFAWRIAPDSGAYRSSFNWTLSAPLPGAGNRTLDATLTATDLATNEPVGTAFDLGNFTALESGGFSPRTDALHVTDSAGPEVGAAPLSWSGSAAVTGPGTTAVLWTLGDGTESPNATVEHAFAAGHYTALLAVRDSFGDVAYDPHPVEVSGALELAASISGTSGTAPFAFAFEASASGGLGPPYEYLWEFGDGGNASAANGTHTFADPGIYRVTLSVVDSGRDSIEKNWTVTVNAAPSTGFPAALLLLVGTVAGVGAGLAGVLVGRRRPVDDSSSP